MTSPVREVTSIADMLAALSSDPLPGQPAGAGRSLVLIGGADATAPALVGELRGLFEVIARHCEATGTAVFDGGTDSGVMRLMGEARAAIGGRFRLIGVAPTGALGRPTKGGVPVGPASHHSLILRVPGSNFGDETTWLFAAADHLARGSASTIVVNGGQLTFDEAQQRLAAGHRVVVVAGSGRAADDLATDERLRGSGRLRLIPLTADEAALGAAIDGGPGR